MTPLLSTDDRGLACPRGAFWIDPWQPVPIAVITHAHSDHARPGSGMYYCTAETERILRRRIGPDALIRPIAYSEPIDFGPVRVSLHPAGHILGSAQVRVEDVSSTWVASGDYKRAADPTCAPFEVVPCDSFITEATFALPIYRWEPSSVIGRDILTWWRACAALDRAAVLMCYALGKAQRVLAELEILRAAGETMPGPVLLHGAVAPLVDDYRAAGIPMLPTQLLSEERPSRKRQSMAGVLALAPPAAGGTPWMRRFGAADRYETAFASGWMRVRGVRRRRGYDRGFILSDHADWPELLATIRDIGARTILATHGATDPLVRYLRESGLNASSLHTQFEGETED